MKNSIAIRKITLAQSPIIQHKLEEAGKEVSRRIEDLELDKQVATVDTVKSLKNLRTELNKELKDFEEQRKYIKEAVNTPYNAFESVYKDEISEKYKSAINTLKDKIASVEDAVKGEKTSVIESYFNELCVSEKIDFITFDKLGISINLSTSEKKYKEQVFSYISKVKDDLQLIKTTDFEAEILTEYKASLNVAEAITVVKTRKENEAKEVARLKAELIQNRKNYLLKLGMQFVDITNSFEYNDDIYITIADVENLSKEDFTVKYSEIEAQIKDIEAKQKKPVNGKEVQAPVSKPIQAPVSKPTEDEPIKTASFEVRATMQQLRALGVYMKQNNIIYKNI